MKAVSEDHNLNTLLLDYLSQMPLFGWIRDTESRYLYMNEQHQVLLGIGADSIHGQSIYDLFPNELAARYARIDQRIMRTGKREVFIEKRNGKFYRVFVFPLTGNSDKVAALGGIEMDITQQKAKEEVLRTEKEFFQALLDNLPYTIYFKDKETRFTRINMAQANLVGLRTPEEAIGKTDFDFFTEKHAKEAFADEEQVLSTGKPLIDKLEKVKNAAGKYVWLSTTKVPIFDTAGQIEGLVGISVDVTDKRNAEINLERALLKAEEADRLKSAFLANMSHDIRTPMNGILGFADLLKNPSINTEQQEKYLNHIIKSGSTLLSLIDDIIDISKIEAGQLRIDKRPVRINEVMDDIFELFENQRRTYNKFFEFRMKKGLPDEKSTIMTDAVRLNQILGNLLSNAFKFTQQGEVAMGYTRKNGMLEFYVKDTGVGIPDEYQEVIFDRFGQAEDTQKINKKGTGLGLAITSNLVDYLGGRIWLESKEGEGSIFYFTLPYETAGDRVKEAEETYQGISRVSWKNAVILIAEDEDLNYLYLVGAIKGSGATIIRARNGKEAIAMAAQHDDISLILMDIKMPFINGYDATRAIKQIHPHLPVIALTAFVSDKDKNKCFEAGCDYFLSKPIKKETLLKVMEGYLEKRQ